MMEYGMNIIKKLSSQKHGGTAISLLITQVHQTFDRQYIAQFGLITDRSNRSTGLAYNRPTTISCGRPFDSISSFIAVPISSNFDGVCICNHRISAR